MYCMANKLLKVAQALPQLFFKLDDLEIINAVYFSYHSNLR